MAVTRDPKLRDLMLKTFSAIAGLDQPTEFRLVRDLREFRELYAYLHAIGLVERFGTAKSNNEGRRLPPDESDFWRLYVGRAFRDVASAGSTDEAFGAVYAVLEESLFAEDATWRLWAPLHRFKSDLPVSNLPNGVSISSINASQRDYLDNLVSRGIRAPHDLILGEQTHVLSKKFTTPKAGPLLGVVEDKDFDMTITALRLIRPGSVSYTFAASALEGPQYGPQFPTGQTGAGWDATKIAASGPGYVLTREDEELLHELVGKLEIASNSAVISRSIDRFNFAYERRRSEDKIVDAWIGLEALFLGREEQMELKYRASLRAARYLGRSASERQWIHDAAKKSYSARSDIVHGDPVPRGVNNIAIFCQELLRRGLRTAVLARQPPRLRELDRQAVRAVPEEA